jgi:UDP:flavonoid glycosyltransferase YjiC (YdhE family)
VSGKLRVIVAAGFGEGHALPALALSRALVARGHEVTMELSERWRGPATSLGADFVGAIDYVAFPDAAPGAQGRTVIDHTRSLVDVIDGLRPDAVVSDLVAAAPPLAAELAGVPSATLVPTLYPVQADGFPPYPIGLLPPRTPVGSWTWRAIDPVLGAVRPTTRWLRRVAPLLDGVRAELGLPALGGERQITTYGAISDSLAMVATFPQLEYPRAWPRGVHVAGPMHFDLPHPEVAPPEGEDPLILVAPSTARRGGHELVATVTSALGSEPVRVLATLNRRGETWSKPAPRNSRVVDWLSYAQVMPKARLVITNGGHGTVTRALAAGVPVLVCPAGADSAENGARAAWAGVGLMLPRRLLSAAALRLAVRRLLDTPGFAARAMELAAWGRDNDGAARAAELVETWARG